MFAKRYLVFSITQRCLRPPHVATAKTGLGYHWLVSTLHPSTKRGLRMDFRSLPVEAAIAHGMETADVAQLTRYGWRRAPMHERFMPMSNIDSRHVSLAG